MSDKATLRRLLSELNKAKPDDRKAIEDRIVLLFDAVRDEEYARADQIIEDYKRLRSDLNILQADYQLACISIDQLRAEIARSKGEQ